MFDHYIQFQNVVKSCGGDGARINALDGVSFEIERGEFCVLLGTIGAGKTTLLNMLGGMDQITSGRIEFDGREISRLKKRESIESVDVFSDEEPVINSGTPYGWLREKKRSLRSFSSTATGVPVHVSGIL